MEPAYEAPIELLVVDQAVARPLVPSPDQTLDLALGGVHLLGLGIREGADALIRDRAWSTGVGLTADYAVAFFLPQLRVFAHEEWHLAALRAGGVTGSDRVLQGEVVGVSDAELIALKATDAAGLVRAHQAGLELQGSLVRGLADDQFASGGRGWSLGPLATSRSFLAPYAQSAELNTWNYLAYCRRPRPTTWSPTSRTTRAASSSATSPGRTAPAGSLICCAPTSRTRRAARTRRATGSAGTWPGRTSAPRSARCCGPSGTCTCWTC